MGSCLLRRCSCLLKGVQLSPKGGAVVSTAPTELLVHYCFVGAPKGVQLSPLGFAACQSKNCTNRVNYTFCFVGALLLCWCT